MARRSSSHNLGPKADASKRGLEKRGLEKRGLEKRGLENRGLGKRGLGILIVRASWFSTALFGVLVIPPVFGVQLMDGLSAGISLLYLLLAMVIWGWALGLAALRTTRGDDVQIASLFLVQGNTRETPRRSLYLSLGVAIAITAVGATADPFVVLAPMLPFGLVGLWGARNGVYPARIGVGLSPSPTSEDKRGSEPQERS